MSLTIYGIQIKGTDYVYIGQSIIIKNRWSKHKSKLNKGQHECIALQAAYDAGHTLEFFIIEENADLHSEAKYIEWLGEFALNQRKRNKIGNLTAPGKYHITIVNEFSDVVWEGWGIKHAARVLDVTHEGVLRYLYNDEGRGWNTKHRVWVTRTSSLKDFDSWHAPLDTRKRYFK